VEISDNILPENKLLPSSKSETDFQQQHKFSFLPSSDQAALPVPPASSPHTSSHTGLPTLPAGPRSKSNPFEIFAFNYSQNEVAVDALRSVVIKPPICEERELPPDTEELVERAKIILRLRQAACQKRWTRESVKKDLLAQKSVNPSPSSTPISTPTTSSSKGSIIPRTARVLPKDNNLSLKKRRQSYVRVSASLDDAGEDDILNQPMTTPSLTSSQSLDCLTTIHDGDDSDDGHGDDDEVRGGGGGGGDQEFGEEQEKMTMTISSQSQSQGQPTEGDSVESLIEYWYETIPDPEMNVGSYEVKTVASALQNRMINDLINTSLIRPLSKFTNKESYKMKKEGAQEKAKGEEGKEGDHEDEDEIISIEKQHLPPITSTDLLPIFLFLSNGRSFPKSDELQDDLFCIEMIYDFYLSKEQDCWETIRIKDNSSIQSLSSRPIFKDLFTRFIHEFRYRDFLEAARQVCDDSFSRTFPPFPVSHV
jgi:hypothetical protein